MRDLASLQRAFHAIVVGTAPLAEARGLVTSGTTDAADRMRIYAHAYVERIGAALAADYPKLMVVLGPHDFAAMVRRYLQRTPPRHWSLREAGDRLAAFLIHDDSWPPWLADLARLERARVEAFDGAEAAVATREELAALPAAAFVDLRVRVVPSAQLVALIHPADQVWSAIEDGSSWEVVDAPPRRVAVWRRGVIVVHRTLADDEADLLTSLAAGDLFADACVATAAHGDPPARALQILVTALDGGLIRAIG